MRNTEDEAEIREPPQQTRAREEEEEVSESLKHKKHFDCTGFYLKCICQIRFELVNPGYSSHCGTTHIQVECSDVYY